MIETLKNAILQNIGQLTSAPDGWMRQNCRMCHLQGHGKDIRRRFGVQFNPDSIVLHCFNCGFSTSYTEGKGLSKPFKSFLKELQLDEKFTKLFEFELFKLRNNLSSIREGDNVDEEVNAESKFKTLFKKWKPISLPDDSLSLSEWQNCNIDDPNFEMVLKYATKRKLINFDKFYWTPNTEFNMNQRLIIPYYYRGEIVGHTSRLCYDTQDKNIPRYFQKCPKDFVYNLDPQESYSRKYVIVNEGVLDAWAVDGVGTLGEMGQTKIDIINRLQKQVIVCPDRDKKGQEMVDAAIENNWSVSFPKWTLDIKDASAATEKYGRLLTTYSILSAAISDKLQIQIKWKIMMAERNKISKYVR